MKLERLGMIKFFQNLLKVDQHKGLSATSLSWLWQETEFTPADSNKETLRKVVLMEVWPGLRK